MVRKQRPLSPSVRFSVIIPVLHESEDINTLIDHVHHLDASSSCEIIVVDGSPTRDTIDAITARDVQRLVSAKGRALQMNTGAAIARGTVLIFLHADTQLPHNALPAIEKALQQPTCVGGAFTVRFTSKKYIFKWIAITGTLRSRFTRIPFGDQVLFLRKTYFHQLGGYSEIPIFEDIDLMRRIRKARGTITILQEQAYTSPRRFEKQGVFATLFWDTLLVLLFYCKVSPDRLKKWYQ
jgi:rSAM/selenodomain-associated transferase 2